jgi:hypothetical protein
MSAVTEDPDPRRGVPLGTRCGTPCCRLQRPGRVPPPWNGPGQGRWGAIPPHRRRRAIGYSRPPIEDAKDVDQRASYECRWRANADDPRRDVPALRACAPSSLARCSCRGDQAPYAIGAMFARSIGVHRRLRLESGTLQVPIPPSKRYAERNHREYPGGKARARIVALLTERPTLAVPRLGHNA